MMHKKLLLKRWEKMTYKEAKRNILALRSDIKMIKSLTNIINKASNKVWVELILKEIDILQKMCDNRELEDGEDY